MNLEGSAGHPRGPEFQSYIDVGISEEDIDSLNNLLNRIFDENEGAERGKVVLSQLNVFLDSNLFDGPDIRRSIEELTGQENKDEFIKKMMHIVKPIFQLQKDDPKRFEVLARDNFATFHEGRINEILFYDIYPESGQIEIHVGPSKTLGEVKIAHLIKDGFKKLAVVVDGNKLINEVKGKSWIFYQNPGLAEKLGFTLGEVEVDSKGESERTGIISREHFRSKYLR